MMGFMITMLGILFSGFVLWKVFVRILRIRNKLRYNAAIDALTNGTTPIMVHLAEPLRNSLRDGKPIQPDHELTSTNTFLRGATPHEIYQANKVLLPIGITLNKKFCATTTEPENEELRFAFTLTEGASSVVFRLFGPEPADPRIPIGRIKRQNSVITHDEGTLLRGSDSPQVLRVMNGKD
jgi:hypothetical protein